MKCGPFLFLISLGRASQLLPMLRMLAQRTVIFRNQSLKQSLLGINEGVGGIWLFCSLFTWHFNCSFQKAWAVILLNFLLLFSELCPFRKWLSRVPLNFGSEVAKSRDKIGPLCWELFPVWSPLTYKMVPQSRCDLVCFCLWQFSQILTVIFRNLESEDG